MTLGEPVVELGKTIRTKLGPSTFRPPGGKVKFVVVDDGLREKFTGRTDAPVSRRRSCVEGLGGVGGFLTGTILLLFPCDGRRTCEGHGRRTCEGVQGVKVKYYSRTRLSVNVTWETPLNLSWIRTFRKDG